MADIAFLFPGQGSQYVGMGKGLANQYEEARLVFQEADEALGFNLSRHCFEGPEEELKKTENQQPALLTVSTAAHRVLQSMGFVPDLVAGHSLGEYSALVAANSFRFSDAVRLVRKRGQYMQQAVPQGVGAMAAILKLPEGKLDEILQQAAQGEVVSAANLNSPEQVVICRECQSCRTRHGAGQGSRRQAGHPVAGERSVPLSINASRPGTIGTRSRPHPFRRSAAAPHQ